MVLEVTEPQVVLSLALAKTPAACCSMPERTVSANRRTPSLACATLLNYGGRLVDGGKDRKAG